MIMNAQQGEKIPYIGILQRYRVYTTSLFIPLNNHRRPKYLLTDHE